MGSCDSVACRAAESNDAALVTKDVHDEARMVQSDLFIGIIDALFTDCGIPKDEAIAAFDTTRHPNGVQVFIVTDEA